jgi:hypothetical protein
MVRFLQFLQGFPFFLSPLPLPFFFLSRSGLPLYKTLSSLAFLSLFQALSVIFLIKAIRVRQVDSFREFKRCCSAYIGYIFNSVIIKRIRCYTLGKDILRFNSFLIAFLNVIINCLRFR